MGEARLPYHQAALYAGPAARGKSSFMLPKGTQIDLMCQETLQQMENNHMSRTSDDLEARERGWQRTGLADAFEPNLLKASLVRKNNNLGHLIFGDAHWAKICEEAQHTDPPLTLSTASDPLSKYFRCDIRLTGCLSLSKTGSVAQSE